MVVIISSRVIKKLTEDAPSTDKVPMAYYHKGFNHMFAIWKHGMSKEVDSFPKLLANNNGEAKAFVELGKKVILCFIYEGFHRILYFAHCPLHLTVPGYALL